MCVRACVRACVCVRALVVMFVPVLMCTFLSRCTLGLLCNVCTLSALSRRVVTLEIPSVISSFRDLAFYLPFFIIFYHLTVV